MSEDLIRYDILTQDALRAMIAKLLEEVARTGLPGDHHFFITFDTCAPDVQLSPRMKEKYPDEMTIVVQHRFWDLEIMEDRFQIGLSFDEIPELLVIPLASIKGFYDPSVKFGLQFEVHHNEQIADEPAPKLTAVPSSTESENSLKKSDGKKKKSKSRKETQELFEDDLNGEVSADPANEPEDTSTIESGSADVVSLDSFRKKK